MTGKKIAILIIVLAAVAAAAVFAFFYFGKQDTAGEKAVFAQPVSALIESYSPTERFSGIVETQKTYKTEFDTEKKLDQLFVAEGDIVKEGDDLFSYDTEATKLEIDQLRLEIDKLNMDINSSNDEINALNANLEKTSAEDKPQQLATIKQLQADIAQAQYDIKSKESEISRKEAAINESVVKAKMGGIIEKIADAQDIIDGKSFKEDGTPDNTFILIRAEGDYRIKGKADEQSIGRLSQGMEVLVRSRIDDKTWSGEVSVIDTHSASSEQSDTMESYTSSGEGESATRYAFYVEPKSTEGILLGQHVIIEPDYGQENIKSGIWLNSGFIVNEDGNTYVWAAKNESSPLEKRSVVTGTYDEDTDEYEITFGLTASDFIAWPGDDCKEGAPITTEFNVNDDDMTTDTGSDTEELMISDDSVSDMEISE